MTILAIILLILLGLLLLLLEFAVIPGVTIAGIGGLALLGGAVYMSFAHYGTLPGIITLAFVLIAAPLLIYRFFRSKSGKVMVLDTLVDGKIDNIDKEKIKPGDTGITLGRLAPSGKVKINGEIVEGQSTGSYINHNTEIKVVKILSNKIIVEPVNK
jgi:membrane-bound ClpP family serine protease